MKPGILENQVRRAIPILGVVTVGAIAVLGMPEAAKATTIVGGSDYVYTLADEGTLFDFGDPLGIEYFKGVPTFAGGTDTVVQRKGDCTFVGGTCTVPIEITELELMSYNSTSNILATLDTSTPSTGTMTINDNGTFSSSFDLYAIASGGVLPSPVKIHKLFTATGQWSGTPSPGIPLVRGQYPDLTANCHNLRGPGCLDSDVTGPNGTPDGMIDSDFFIVDKVLHTAPGAEHTVHSDPVPEPLTILGSVTALGFGSFFKRKLAKKDKA